MNHILNAKQVIKEEINGLLEVESKLNDTFEFLIEKILSSNGRVVMCGMGKSGHIAKKIFATLVSTGTPSMYMHPAEAFHGDLGMIKEEDIFFAISNSGETSEVTQLLPYIKANGNVLISMTGNPQSTLGTLSDYHIDIGVRKEACPLNLAPTTSTTASLVIGDAIAVALMTARGFEEENFAKYHPGGSLGRKLLLTVKEEATEVPFVGLKESFINILTSISSSSLGAILVGTQSNLLGIITDGDIRKYLAKVDCESILNATSQDIMSVSPKTVSSVTRCGDADKKMINEAVNSLVVKEGNIVIGIYANLNRK